MANEERRLADRQVVCIPGDAHGAQLYCTAGTLWITRAGDADDHVLRAGETFSLEGEGRVVVEALGPAAFRLTAVEASVSARTVAPRCGSESSRAMSAFEKTG